MKYLVPDGISGAPGLEGVHNGRVDFAALDRKGQPTRIRLGATVVRVEHAQSAADGEHVVGRLRAGGKPYRARARAVVMASGGGMSRAVLADMPADMRAAYATFQHAPALVVNVALTNWRFLHTLGAPCARWFDDEFGFSCNIRRPMITGGAPAPMTPADPAVLTFYMGLYAPGKTMAEQVASGRKRLLETSYADFERLIRRHMTRLFAQRRLRRAPRHRRHHPQSLGPRAARAAAGLLLRPRTASRRRARSSRRATAASRSATPSSAAIRARRARWRRASARRYRRCKRERKEPGRARWPCVR